ncbi:hypothetical protein PENTCL1PPCAC_10316, partial [Pristionchus entomophagus]
MHFSIFIRRELLVCRAVSCDRVGWFEGGGRGAGGGRSRRRRRGKHLSGGRGVDGVFQVEDRQQHCAPGGRRWLTGGGGAGRAGGRSGRALGGAGSAAARHVVVLVFRLRQRLVVLGRLLGRGCGRLLHGLHGLHEWQRRRVGCSCCCDHRGSGCNHGRGLLQLLRGGLRRRCSNVEDVRRVQRLLLLQILQGLWGRDGDSDLCCSGCSRSLLLLLVLHDEAGRGHGFHRCGSADGRRVLPEGSAGSAGTSEGWGRGTRAHHHAQRSARREAAAMLHLLLLVLWEMGCRGGGAGGRLLLLLLM